MAARAPLSPVSAWSTQVGADPFSCLAQFVNLGRMGLGTVQVCTLTLKLFIFQGICITLFSMTCRHFISHIDIIREVTKLVLQQAHRHPQ